MVLREKLGTRNQCPVNTDQELDKVKEGNVDISKQSSTKLTPNLLQRADLTITLCGHADENFPILPQEVEKRHWPLEDSAKAQGSEEEILAQFRAIRNEIKSQIEELVAELKPSSPRHF